MKINQLIFDEVKAYKNYAKFLDHILQDVTVTLDNNWVNDFSCC